MLNGNQCVVLYHPRDSGSAMPLGLLALASYFGEDEVVIVDGRHEIAPEARVVELAPRAVCLGVGVRTGEPLRDALRVSAAARVANPKLTVLWGGPHPTLAPESCFAPDGVVDACVRGAGDLALPAAVEAVRRGRGLHGVPGLLLAGAPPAQSQRAPAPELWPRARYSLIDLERHFEQAGVRRLDYCSSRGARASRDWAALCAERVIDELRELVERHALTELVFRDEDFFADPPRAEAIAEGLAAVSPRLGWRAAARVEDVLDGGHDRLELLARCRCRKLLLPVVGLPAAPEARERVLDAGRLMRAARVPGRFELWVDEPRSGGADLRAAVSVARSLCALDPVFETPVRRWPALRPEEPPPSSLEGWVARWDAPWPDEKAQARLDRTAFFFAEAQRPPGRRIGQHLLRMFSLLRVRLGFFALDLERRVVEAAAVLRTGRSRSLPNDD